MRSALSMPATPVNVNPCPMLAPSASDPERPSSPVSDPLRPDLCTLWLCSRGLRSHDAGRGHRPGASPPLATAEQVDQARAAAATEHQLSLIHISEPTRQ